MTSRDIDSCSSLNLLFLKGEKRKRFYSEFSRFGLIFQLLLNRFFKIRFQMKMSDLIQKKNLSCLNLAIVLDSMKDESVKPNEPMS